MWFLDILFDSHRFLYFNVFYDRSNQFNRSIFLHFMDKSKRIIYLITIVVFRTSYLRHWIFNSRPFFSTVIFIQINLKTYSYSKEKYLEDRDALNHCYPTILDMTGFQDTYDEAVRETLGMIFEGRIREGTKLNNEGRSRRYKNKYKM